MNGTRMGRRAFSQSMLAGSIGLAVLGSSAKASDDVARTWYREFHASLRNHPWLKVFRGLNPEALPEIDAELSGNWPNELEGTLYRNGPAPFERGQGRLQHWFDGNGMIQAWTLRNGEIKHRARFVDTHRYIEESERQQYLYGGFASKETVDIGSPDVLNSSNTSVIYRNDELWSLWEAGSPWRVDPQSLATKGV